MKPREIAARPLGWDSVKGSRLTSPSAVFEFRQIAGVLCLRVDDQAEDCPHWFIFDEIPFVPMTLSR
ncbi:MAG: hypothetical protein NTW19_00660 [Planctomycetota bacterium]|nr:hypothetical protein [Planctomycetota bacterium]